jgi:protein-disulfide isomerase
MRINKDLLFVIGFAGLAACVGYNYTYGTKSIQRLEKSTNISITPSSSDNSTDMKQFLLDNPTAIIDSLENYKTEMMANQEKEIQTQIVKNYDKIYSDNSFTIGNPDAEIKIVEFFDYKCGYCKVAAKTIEKLVAENPNVQVYMKDMPILSEASMEAAKAAVAAGFLGKYKEYSKALMETKDELNEETFRKIAKEVGVDGNELIEMTNSEKVSELLMENRMAATIVGLQGTPTILIEGTTYRGDFSLGSLQEAIRTEMEAK